MVRKLTPDTVDWVTFFNYWCKNWKQGEHVTVIGPTGSGKTLVCEQLVRVRSHVVVTGVKHADSSLEGLMKAEWVRVNKWKDRHRSSRRVVLWPKESNIQRVQGVHRKVFSDLLADVYKRGSWCIWTDELRYMTDIIGLKKEYVLMYIAARSNRISLVSAAQRPSHVPLEAYSQAQHLILFRTGDERDLARAGGLNGADAKQVAATVSQLPKHHFLYINLNNGEQMVSTLNLKGKQ